MHRLCAGVIMSQSRQRLASRKGTKLTFDVVIADPHARRTTMIRNGDWGILHSKAFSPGIDDSESNPMGVEPPQDLLRLGWCPIGLMEQGGGGGRAFCTLSEYAAVSRTG
jgi:hypothetical protein